jgi:membrane-bound metal-dependent hydrolase YbcI (DUF457 family)
MSGIGHLAPAFLVKTAEPNVPLWVWLAASETNEALYFLFTAAGIEKPAEISIDFQHGVQYLAANSYPWSHGLFMSVVWSAVAAGIGLRCFHSRRAGCLIGLVVLSHWLLDFLMHANLPLFFDGSPKVGLGLETTGAGLVFMTLLDLALLAGSIALYWIRRRQARIAPMVRA